MDSITLKNFRCFREEQTARLAPLTLLVGENSTGKTSFLALIRAIWNLAYRYRIPDFKEEPYDLGSFDEISHHRGARGGRADEFQAGFNGKRRGRGRRAPATRFDFTFAKVGTAPVPARRRISLEAKRGSPKLLPSHTDLESERWAVHGRCEFPTTCELATYFLMTNT